ncbi:MAG: MarR family winged helix-turn-helix transcriptional regulator [Acutalibacteraceae bacterium]
MVQFVNMDFSHALLEAYAKACKPLCQEIRMPQTAFDILMFLANNPTYNSARDIVAIRGLKANLVSVNVDKLVKEGFLERCPDREDRRKTILTCTELALPIVQRGRRFQQTFFEELFQGITEDERMIFADILKKIRNNITYLSKDGM